MIIRNAYFEGTINETDKEKFDQLIINDLIPLIKKFPNIRDVKVLKNIWQEDDAPPIYMILQLSFDSRTELEAALKSPERDASKAKAEVILKMLKGKVYHMTYTLM